MREWILKVSRVWLAQAQAMANARPWGRRAWQVWWAAEKPRWLERSQMTVAGNGGRKKVHMCWGEGVLSWEVIVNLGFTRSEVLLWIGSSVNPTPLLYLPLLLGQETCKLHFPDSLACWLPVNFCHWKVLAESEESSFHLPPSHTYSQWECWKPCPRGSCMSSSSSWECWLRQLGSNSGHLRGSDCRFMPVFSLWFLQPKWGSGFLLLLMFVINSL